MKKKTSHIKSKKLKKPVKKSKDVLDASLTPELTPTKAPRGKQKEHYVNSKEFEGDITEYYKTDYMSIRLGESLNKIAKGLSYAPNFINYSYKEEMIGDAILKMVSALKNKKFKLNSGFSPFSYFTTIAFHAFINRIKKEKKHHETTNNYKEKVYIDLLTKQDGERRYNIYVDPTSEESSDDNYNATGN